jgi:hypothetical protein
MESTRTSTTTTRPLSTALSPLRQNPVPLSLPPSPHAMHTVFLDHPIARISSSPASSPRIIDAHPFRRSSVYPAMSDTMERGIQPGADFFDDGSSDSDWEDTEGEITNTFSDTDGLGLGNFLQAPRERLHGSSRGRSRERSILTALPPFRHLPSQRSTMAMSMDNESVSSTVNGKRTERAREVSVRRMSKDSVRVVHHHSSSTPRGSRSNSSSTNAAFAALPRLFPTSSITSTELPRTYQIEGRHRRNTDSDSIIAGSIIDAHVMTMRALESLNDSPSGILTKSNSRTFGPSSTSNDFPKFSSFTNDRHITLSPLTTKRTGRDKDRPAHLPAHFIRTPYPFTAKKVFPKPQQRPRQHAGSDEHPARRRGSLSLDRLDSGYDDNDNDSQREYDDRKGKHVLGLMASEGQYDLRSRLERNSEAQGVIRSRDDPGREGEDSTVWLSLQRKTYRQAQTCAKALRLVKVTVPSSLTASSPIKEKHPKGPAMVVEFDDKFFAERLRAGYKSLAGNWFQRAFSARKLQYIRLAQINTWSGTCSSPCISGSAAGLLAAGAGIDTDTDTKSPFSEDGLMALYSHPRIGKARYTWVHWAQRVAQSNSTNQRRRMNNAFRFPAPIETPSNPDSDLPDTVTTIQFVHSYSTPRILAALAFMLLFSVAAAFLWIFLGSAGTGIRTGEENQRSDRVGSGMAIGILVLLLESMAFGSWMWRS